MTERPDGTPEEAPAEPTEPSEPEAPTAAGVDALEPEAEEEEAEEESAIPPAAGAAAAGAAAAAATGPRRSRGPSTPAPRPMTPGERAAKMTDRPSRYFVIVSVAVFVLILLYGLLGGHGGFLTPVPVPTATAPGTAEPSSSAGPSGSAGASGSPATSASAAPSVAPSA